MASYERESRKMFARDLAAFNDVELDQYLEEHRLEGGATTVDVEDPENLPESFIQRLRDRAQNTSDAAQSGAVDLNQVTTRLLEIPADRDTSFTPLRRPLRGPCSSTDSGPPTPPQVHERAYYNELVNDGGRPLYPIDLVDNVAEDPEAHQDMLRPWLGYPEADPPNWEVFREQGDHWREFREWQAEARGLGFPKYRRIAYDVFRWHFQRASPTYTEAVKELLAQYGFTRPFQLHDDPKQQDKLTTWIEYLGFACAQHYRDVRFMKVRQPKYDEAWKTLVDAKVLRPFETEGYICTKDCAFQHQKEREQAFNAVKSAEKVLISAQKAENDPRESRRGKPATSIQSRAAQSRLDTAKESQASTNRRNDLVTEFNIAVRGYLIAKDDAMSHSAILQWVLEQVPLVEAEMNESGVTETSPDPIRGTKRSRGPDNVDTQNQISQKRRWDTHKPNSPSDHNTRSGSQGGTHKRSHDDTTDDKPPSKRFRNDGQDLASRNNAPSGAKTKSAGEPQESGTSEIGRPDGDKQAVTKAKGYPSPKATKPANDFQLQRKSTQDAPQPSATSPPLRRSARIAARQQVSKTMNSPGAAKNSPRTTQKPAPLSSTRPQNQQSTSPPTKITKHGASGNSRRNKSKAMGTYKGR
ncbi:putative ankyrin [Rosellinia necatrix]|uniref:Putative ankyrin n=1 Tax=Rosellinia necatrix TaxID=77044 RepID=A0A1W2TV40_ROSNE|nr:putative ankyrin [Rosellinia necatrix]